MITPTRSRTWKVEVDTEPKIAVVSLLHNLFNARCFLCNTSPTPFWNLELRFSNPQRENTLRKVWPNSTIYQDRVKKKDPSKTTSHSQVWQWSNLSDSSHDCDTQKSQKKESPLVVMEGLIPDWPDPNNQVFAELWPFYAQWIMDTLEQNTFTCSLPTLNEKHIPIIMQNEDIYSFDTSSTWLVGCGVYYNYKLEKVVLRKYPMEKFSASFTNDDIKMEPLDFDNLSQCVLIQADCSMGKTSVGMKSLIDHHKQLNHSILLVTENRALSFHLQKLFPTFLHYLSLTDMDTLSDKNSPRSHMICQLESLTRLSQFPLYDVLVMDEITSCFSHIIATTMEKTLGPSFNVLLNHLQQSKYVYGFDADIPQEVVHLFAVLRPNDSPHIIAYSHQPLLHRQLFITNSQKQLSSSLRSSLLNGMNCVLVHQSVKASKKDFAEFFDIADSVLLINSEGASLAVDGHVVYDQDDNMKKLALSNPQDHFSQVQLLIYTPSIKTGVSFECPHFHRVYAVASRGSSTAREFHQSLLRVRHIQREEYIVCLGNTTIGSVHTMKETKEYKVSHLNTMEQLYPSKVQSSPFNHGYLPAIATPYSNISFAQQTIMTIRQFAESEKEESKWNFGAVFMNFMCQQRGFVFDYLHHIEEQSTLNLDVITESHKHTASQTERIDTIERIMRAEDIDHHEFLRLRNKQSKQSLNRSEKASIKRYLLKGQLGLACNQFLKKELLDTYMDYGDYVLFLRSIEPSIPSNAGELQHLQSQHEKMRAQLQAKVATIKEKECNEQEQTILEIALKLYTKPRYKKADIAFELLQMLGFSWHGDQRIQNGQQLDNNWKTCIAPWVKNHLFRIKKLFQLIRTTHLNEKSSRKHYLGAINTLLHSGLGIRIHCLGSNQNQKNDFGIHTDIPLISSSGVKLRSKRPLRDGMQENDCLVLKRLKSSGLCSSS